MSAQILDGKALAQTVRDALTKEVEEITPKLGRKPGLAVILIGDNPASKVYVASKTKAAEGCGIAVFDYKRPATISNKELVDLISEINARPEIDGILLQLPLPKGLDEYAALCAISPEKDADGLHPVSQGRLVRGAPGFLACTPSGCMLLIDQAMRQLGRSQDIAGLNAVVVGRSILVGKPVGLLLLQRNCTVTYAHSKTRNLASVCREADILVVAAGKSKLIGRDYIKPGAVVVDVGMNRDEDGKLVGDVDFDAATSVASAITPVPGGVGPMTIAMLLSNTVQSARNKL